MEQLRAKTYSEGQYAETFRRMEEENKEMKLLIDTLEAKNIGLLGDLTVSDESIYYW